MSFDEHNKRERLSPVRCSAWLGVWDDTLEKQ